MVIYPSSFTFASVPVSLSVVAVAWPERRVASVSATNRSFRTGILHRQLLFTAIFAILDNLSSCRMEDRRWTRIRLWGIDAPESTQLCRGEDSLQYRCGAKAANDLDAFIARRPVSCIPISHDQYGRRGASCSVGGVDLGEWLGSNGLALDLPQDSRGRDGNVQRNAAQAGRS